jgi:hypothetical protein
VKKAVLDQLIDCYNQLNQPGQGDRCRYPPAAGRSQQHQGHLRLRLLKKQQCGKSLDASGVTTDPQTCDDAAALAQKGLTVPKPAAWTPTGRN